jgi:tetratricopeptide (TPR) repeat protein
MALTLLAGCATAYSAGRTSLRQGRYAEAAEEFQAALNEAPGRVDALVGLGVARYKMGAYEEAEEALGRAVTQAPKNGEARLYLALTQVQKGEDTAAAEQLGAFLLLQPSARLERQIDAAVKLLRSDRPLTTEMRSYVATSLEESARLAREVRDAQWAAQRAYASPAFYPLHCYPTRHGRIVCF